MALAGLKALSDGEELQEFINKLNRGFFEISFVTENPPLKMAITQKTCAATKHRTVKEEEARKSMEDYGDTGRYPDGPNKLEEGKHWRKMNQRREVQPTNDRELQC
ncbi:hypothetical protein Trydic_g23038 [Trypoxylus dichotomus]